jgi:hypothetical protein
MPGVAAPDAAVAEMPETSAAAEAPTSSSNLVAEEELEVVFGRQLQLPEEETTPLPQVLTQVRQSIVEATSSTEAAFRQEWSALESERQCLSD